MVEQIARAPLVRIVRKFVVVVNLLLAIVVVVFYLFLSLLLDDWIIEWVGDAAPLPRHKYQFAVLGGPHRTCQPLLGRGGVEPMRRFRRPKHSQHQRSLGQLNVGSGRWYVLRRLGGGTAIAATALLSKQRAKLSAVVVVVLLILLLQFTLPFLLAGILLRAES